MKIHLHNLGVILIVSLAAGACAHTPASGTWGSEATLTPGWSAVKRAAKRAAADPFTWAPALTAAAFQIGNADEDFADNVRRNRPVFGSAGTAEDVSDTLRLASIAVFTSLALTTPGREDSRQWYAKGGGLLVGAAALGVTTGLTDGFKSLTDRTRPNRRDNDSLPSGHASTTAAAARLAADALAYHRMNQGMRIAAGTGLVALTGATAWARLEAGQHFPSDVLLGAALGNFIARFTAEAFLHPGRDTRPVLGVEPLPEGGIHLTLQMPFF